MRPITAPRRLDSQLRMRGPRSQQMQTMIKEPTVAMLKVKTLLRGELEVAEDQLITFASPLLGFDKHRRFLLYQTESGPTHWLQSVDDLKVCFCLLAPFEAGI